VGPFGNVGCERVAGARWSRKIRLSRVVSGGVRGNTCGVVRGAVGPPAKQGFAPMEVSVAGGLRFACLWGRATNAEPHRLCATETGRRQ
jgi:hypothetical protein